MTTLRDLKLAYGRGNVTAGQAAIAVLASGYRLPAGHETSLATMAAYINDFWPTLVERPAEGDSHGSV